MSEYSSLRLVNAVVIGYMVGTREVIGRGGAQAITILGESFPCAARLTPGDVCTLHLKRK